MGKSLPNTLPAFFWYFLRNYKWHLSLILGIGVFWGVYNSLSPYLLKLIIDSVAETKGGYEEVFAAALPYLVIYICLWLSIASAFRLLDYINLQLHPNVRRDIVNAMFAYLNQHSHKYFQNNFAGSLSNKISDMTSGGVSVLQKIEDGFSQLMGLVVVFPFMFYVHPLFGGILFFWFIAFMSITVYFAKNVKNLSKIFSESRTTLVGKIVDSISNVGSSRIFARRDRENLIIYDQVNDTVSKDRKMQWYILYMHILWDVTILILIFSMIVTLIHLYGLGEVSIGDFAFIMTVSMSIFQSMWWLSKQYVQFTEEMGRCAQALTIISVPHEIKDEDNAKPLKVKKGEIKFDKVTFNYVRGDNIFEEESIVINPGEKVGLVGFSGSGKTTFVNLILRFFDIESGKILIDGQDIAKVTQDSLRSNIAMIPQDTSLFHRSLMDNIRYGRIEASDEEVKKAAKIAHCDEFIEKLPEGYNSLVGERGIKLSGGQRQRIAIARAILKDAPILILDEATSALDSVTEKYIQNSLNRLMKNRTTIIIAHRLSTLAEMDRVLVFDNGHVIESGSHDELLKKKNGHYAKMWSMQAGGFLPESD